MSLYARTLSAVARDGRKGGSGELAGKSNEQLLEMAMDVPEIREALRKLGHAD